jgi:myo-inositol-1-phosphate synthase
MGTEKQGGQKAAEASKIAPATGKLGVMVVGLGAVATTFIAGVEAVRRGLGQADRVADADGHHPPGQAHRQ